MSANTRSNSGGSGSLFSNLFGSNSDSLKKYIDGLEAKIRELEAVNSKLS
jgi:hypothetical protein